MALTGLALLLFVLIHLLGNLQIYLGPDAINAYAKKLASLGGILWVMRGGLLAIFALHVASAIRLTLRNRAARPVRYDTQQALEAGIASRTLIYSGFVVMAFLIYHILHFTIGTTDPSIMVDDGHGHRDVYSMVILGFQNTPVAIAYIVAMVLLGFHLHHAIASLAQTLGLSHPGYRTTMARVGPVLAFLIAAGNLSIPLAVLSGFLGLPAGGQ
jgi:succinate dehydrogenase / fumarate reductase cytochrome b subunit